MAVARLRGQANICVEIARFMSLHSDRDELLRSHESLLATAEQQENRPTPSRAATGAQHVAS